MEEEFLKGSFPDADRTEIDRRKALSPLTGDTLEGPEDEEKQRSQELHARAEAQSVEEAMVRELAEAHFVAGAGASVASGSTVADSRPESVVSALQSRAPAATSATQPSTDPAQAVHFGASHQLSSGHVVTALNTTQQSTISSPASLSGVSTMQLSSSATSAQPPVPGKRY